MPQIFGWSEREFDERANGLAALIRKIWRFIARQLVANAERQLSITMEAARPIPSQWNKALDDDVAIFIQNTYLDAAGRISDELNAPEELLIGDDLVEIHVNAARNRLSGIGDEVYQDVKAQIAFGNSNGESVAEIAERVRNVTGVSEARSLTIARTEVHAALEAGSYEQAMYVDPNAEKTWLATDDERTRPSHRRADGQTVKIGEPFQIGGVPLRFPGDPLGPAGECVNCRCSVAYNFDMITADADEPEPAMTASGKKVWKPHLHPRGADGKFIGKGALSDFLKKSKPNIIDVTKAVGSLNSTQWNKLTPEQKQHIKDSVDKLPKGTVTHDTAKKQLDMFENAAGDSGTTNAPSTSTTTPAPTSTSPANPTKIPAGLKGKPGDPAKITTGVVWGKHNPGDVIVEDKNGDLRVVWNGKKYEVQESMSQPGTWVTKNSLTKKDFYNKYKGENSDWFIPGGAAAATQTDADVTPDPPSAPSAPDTTIDKDKLQSQYDKGLLTTAEFIEHSGGDFPYDVIDGDDLSLKQAHTLVIKPTTPYADGQIIATSNDGKSTIAWSAAEKNYVHTDADGNQTWPTKLNTIKTIRSSGWKVPADLVPGGTGDSPKPKVESYSYDPPTPAVPTAPSFLNDDSIPDTSKTGTSAPGAIISLFDGKYPAMATADGKVKIAKADSPMGKYAVTQKHLDGSVTTNYADNSGDVQFIVGDKLWYPLTTASPQHDPSFSIPDDLPTDVALSNVMLGDHPSVHSPDGKYEITKGTHAKFAIKIKNPDGTLELYDFDVPSELYGYIPNAPTSWIPTKNTSGVAKEDIDWSILSKLHTYGEGDVVLRDNITGAQLFKTPSGLGILQDKNNTGSFTMAGMWFDDEFDQVKTDLPQGSWSVVPPGTKFTIDAPKKTTPTPTKKAVKAAKKAVPPSSVTAFDALTENDKSFYLDDASWGELAPAEAVHLINGEGGLTLEETKQLTPAQIQTIDSALNNAAENNMSGSSVAIATWSSYKSELNQSSSTSTPSPTMSAPSATTAPSAPSAASPLTANEIDDNINGGDYTGSQVIGVSQDGNYMLQYSAFLQGVQFKHKVNDTGDVWDDWDVLGTWDDTNGSPASDFFNAYPDVKLFAPDDPNDIVAPKPAATPSTPAPAPVSTPTPSPTPSPASVVPAAPISMWKISGLKADMKSNGNVGYWSKPEKIWEAIKKFQSQPGNETYSPLDIFKALDKTLKTSKPNPFEEKMTKWASTPKGIQTIGADSIYSSSPSTPSVTAPTTPKPSSPNAKKVTLPDIESGNDISSISAAKQQSIYTEFKNQPDTYLDSPAESIFEAIQTVSKQENLTLAQVINVIDEVGAQKVSKPNAGLFKKKLTDWLKTPAAAAYILNEPEQVTGLPEPPKYLPQYDPNKLLPSFEESSKFEYRPLKSTADANKFWDDVVTKTAPLSPSQKSALKTWTGGTYATVNKYLFKPNMPALSPTHKGVAKGSQGGMRPSDRPILLVRGTDYAALGNAKSFEQLEKLVGSTWRNNAFAATSVGVDYNGVAAPAFSSYPMWIEFECPPGTPMAWLEPFSQHKGEREMLLGADLHYRIVSVEKKNVPGYGMKTIARVRIVPKPDEEAAE